MPESTSSQSSTPAPYYEPNGLCNVTDNQWNHIQSTGSNIAQNGTTLVWRELPVPNVIPVPVNTSNIATVHHVTSSINNINGLNQQITCAPPSYMNFPYQQSNISNGYNASNVSRGIHGQVVNTSNIIRNQNGLISAGSNWPNQSLVGRYVSPVPTWPNNKTSGGVKKQKRIRTAFTSQQMMELEQEYARTRYLDRTRRIELADILRLNERTIKIWFQNRRMKEKKDRAENLEDSAEVSTSELSPEMNNIQAPVLIHEQYQNISNEIYNQGGVYIEPFPTSSMPTTTTNMPQMPVPVQSTYPEYITEEQCHAHLQQVHLQVQQYSSPYSCEVQESSPDKLPPAEVTTTSAPSDIIEKSWDLSWIRSIQDEEDIS